MANLIITNYCNLRCPYCFAKEAVMDGFTPVNMTLEQVATILDFVKTSPYGKRIAIIGGEPTLHPQVREICEYVHENLPADGKMSIFSNGVHLEKVLDLLCSDFNCLINFNHPDDCGIDNYNKTCENLKKAVEMGKFPYISVGINLYPGMPGYDYLFDLKRNGTFNFTHIRVSTVAPANQIKYKDRDVYYTESKKPFLEVLKLCEEYNVEVKIDCNHIPSCYFTPEELELCERVCGSAVKRTCLPTIDIDSNYNALRCFGKPDINANLFDYETFDDLVKAFQENVKCQLLEKLPQECKQCKYGKFGACKGGCLSFLS